MAKALLPPDVFMAMIDIAKRRGLDPLAKRSSKRPVRAQRGTDVSLSTIDATVHAEPTGQYAEIDAGPSSAGTTDIRTHVGSKSSTSDYCTVGYKLATAASSTPFSSHASVPTWEEYAV